ncbi:MAG TPA: hypothetical protein VHY09_04685 [Candidatus Methylacidiphilales bacterium]|jgi:hypothetical protein|nr:hypothetical protein [Candidatus Methylacidiphilales bacterium]
MKIRLPLLLLAIAALALPTGCASVQESPYLTPSAIRSSFANVQVQIAHGTLRVVLQSDRNLQDLRFVHGTISNFNPPQPLVLTGTVYDPRTPNQIELDFTPALAPPFNIDLTTTLHGERLTLRADYYGPRRITF